MNACVTTTATVKKSPEEIYQGYINFFEKVYQTMDKNYYHEVSREKFDEFIGEFKTKIFDKLEGEKKSIDDYVRWRSASLLIHKLKAGEDIFSEFYPPAPAQKYQQTALDVRVNLGIEGEKIEKGFGVTQVEPRSDAYVKGLRIGDVILNIDGKDIKPLESADVQKLINPLQGHSAQITFWNSAESKEQKIEVVPTEFFRQSVFMMPIAFPGVYGVEIRQFNRKTAEDLLRFMDYFRKKGDIKGIIIDLRGNPGGPPLAAREISAFFLPPGEDFAYFQKKGEPKAMLDVPAIPPQYHYDGPLAILINQGSGSSSELFSGVLQHRGRAVLIGKNSAGQVMLKSMFNFDDGSMVLLVTSKGYYADGHGFSFTGLVPDRYMEGGSDVDLVKEAIKYFLYENRTEQKIKN